MKDTLKQIQNTIDTHRLYTTVKEVSSYHRIQCTPTFRDAANYVLNTLHKEGIDAQILSYEADPSVWYLQSKMFKEWDLKEAFIELVEPNMMLADALGNPTSIVQRSYPCDFMDGKQLLYLNKGTDPSNYEGIDFTDKIVFFRENFDNYLWAMEKGAIGFVTDFIREVKGARTRYDLYDSLNYTSFWWKHTEDEVKTFGFVLTPKQGDILANLCLNAKEPLIVKGKVDATLYNGKMEVVEAKLPGETDEEVLLTAHLCHPKASCNDNASGVAATIEALRTIKYLIESGKLPKNKRTIKLVLMPEFTGTYAYLSDHTDYKKTVGAFNLDMVGGKQTRYYGPITLTDIPYSTPSFISALTELCLNLAGEEAPNLAGEMVNKTNYVVEPFSGGSDHTVYSDPTIGVPCCMLGQWPDLNYHTSTDTIDVIDPEVLAFSCRTATLFAYTLANLTLEDVKAIQTKAHVKLAQKLATVKTSDELEHVRSFFIESVKDYKRVIDLEDCFVENEVKYINAVCDATKVYKPLECTPALEDTRIFKRNFVGPIQDMSENVAANPQYKGAFEVYNKKCDELGIGFHNDATSLVLYYINGVNTVGDIAKKVECDKQENYDAFVECYIELLETMTLIEKVN